MTSKLKKFEGREVRGVEITITKPGNALSRSIEIAPEVHHTGDIVHVVLECRVGAIDHKPDKGDPDSYVRVEEFKAILATVVSANLVSEVLDTQRELIRIADEEKRGVLSFPDPDADDEDQDGSDTDDEA